MNKKRILFWAILSLIVVGLLAFFGWFWSLSEVQASEPPQVTVEVVTPSVEWRRASEDAWKPLTETSVILPGDRIRTGVGGEARVTWGDRGYTRVEEETELVIEQSPLDGAIAPAVEIRMNVVSGRIWSRMLKLLDLDSTVEVKTADVVATVRGTTFGVGKTAEGSDVTVTESVVEVVGNEGSTLIRDNQVGRFGAGAAMRELRDLGMGDAWAMNNIQKDVTDDEKFAEKLRARSEKLAGQIGGAPLALVDASERMRLRISPATETAKLAFMYGERQVARHLTMGLDRDWETLQRLADQSGDRKGKLMGVMHAAIASRARVEGLAPLSHMRDMRRNLSAPTPAARTYLDALGIDERIDDVILREGDRTPERLKPIAEDLEIFEKRMEEVQGSEKEMMGLRRKAAALRKRLDYAMTLPSPMPVEEPVTDVKDPIQGTQIPDAIVKPSPLIKPITAPTPTPTTVVGYQRYTLLATPSMADVGQPVRLAFFGVTPDGRADDLTTKTVFNALNPSVGNISGNIFTPALAGTWAVNGSYRDMNGVTRAASAQIVVRASTQPVTSGLQSISIVFTGPTTLPCGGRSPFKVYAKYADGKSQDVTMLSTFTVSDPKLIFAGADAVVSAFCTVQTASATLGATYTEGQVTRTASAIITVEPNPVPVTGGCTGRQCP